MIEGESCALAPARVLACQLDLAKAWQRVEAKAGMPGVDGVSISQFRRNAAAQLRSLTATLANGNYKPWPLRLAEIEKKSGGRRQLMIPTVADRIAQSAVTQWLSGKWNNQMDPASFAYRPGRSVSDAFRAIATLREQGFSWVLDADIRSFFDSIDLKILTARLAKWMGAESPMLTWVKLWLEGPVWDGEVIGKISRGVAQGSPLSPLLANFYLDAFDQAMRSEGIRFVRYADDFVVLARSPFELAEWQAMIERTLGGLNLELNTTKTRTTHFARHFKFLGAEMQGESILLPFEKKKGNEGLIFVAPAMPPSLRRLYRAGKAPIVAFQPRVHKVEEAAKAPETRKSLLDALRNPG